MFRKLLANLLAGTGPSPSEGWRSRFPPAETWRSRELPNDFDKFVTSNKNKFEFVQNQDCILVFKKQNPKFKISLPEGYRQWDEGMEYSVDAGIDGTDYRFQIVVKKGLSWQVRTHSAKRSEISYVRMGE